MEKLRRIIIAACCSIAITVFLVFFMIALVALNEEQSPPNHLSSIHQVSHAPGLEPSREINSESNRKHHQLPAKRQVKLPINHRHLLAHIRSQEANGDHKDPNAAPLSQQLLLTPGHQAMASVKLDGIFNITGPAPKYPAPALLNGQEGWVEAMIHLKKDGTVSHIDILDAGPKGVFEESILAAVIEWKVAPTDGPVPLEEEYKHRFEFQITQ